MFECNICNKKFNSQKALNGHNTIVHIKKLNILKRITIIKICPKCSNSFAVIRTIRKNGKEYIAPKEKKYCSRKCANAREITEEIKNKISLSLKGKSFRDNWKRPKNEYKYCHCGKRLNANNKTGFCRKHWIEDKKLNMSLFEIYKNKCKFKFNIFNYPDEFDLSLINQFGIYRAANRGYNPNGVSRDHIYSIAEGYKNKIDAKIISHPANCRIIAQKENAKKNTKSDISLNDLLLKIKLWNDKYARRAGWEGIKFTP